MGCPSKNGIHFQGLGDCVKKDWLPWEKICYCKDLPFGIAEKMTSHEYYGQWTHPGNSSAATLMIFILCILALFRLPLRVHVI